MLLMSLRVILQDWLMIRMINKWSLPMDIFLIREKNAQRCDLNIGVDHVYESVIFLVKINL